jgi:tetratricopeptide (TPR) repeat protein
VVTLENIMSLINDMLHDLEKRSASEKPELADVYPLFSELQLPEAEKRTLNWRFILPCLMVIAGGILAIFLWRTGYTGIDPVQHLDTAVAVDEVPPEVAAAAETALQKVQVSETSTEIVTWSSQAEKKFLRLNAQDNVPIAAPGAVDPLKKKPERKPTIQPEMEPGTKPIDLAPTRIKDRQAVAVTRAPQPAPSVEDMQKIALKEARLLVFRGRREQAKTRLFRLLSNYPQARDARLVLAGWVVQDRQWSRAEQLLSLVDQQSDRHMRIFKARTLLSREKLDQAIRLLTPDQPSMEESPEFFALLALLYQREGRFPESVAVYRDLTRFKPARGDWWGGLAIGLDKSGDKLAALDAYRQVLMSGSVAPDLERFSRQRINLLSRWEN